MKKIADEDPWTTPATIEDPKTLDEIKEALKTRGRYSAGAAARDSMPVSSSAGR
jgi:hypothetical protein